MTHTHCKHHHDDVKPDFWTTTSAAGEFFSGYISNTWWFATLFDISTGFKGDALPISWYAFAFGFTLAFLSASGATYSHWVLNKNHQAMHQHHHSEHEHEDKHEHNHAHMSINENEETLLLNSTQTPEKRLSFFQNIALLGDFIAHAGESAGPITFVIMLASGNNLPRWGQIIVHVLAALYGGVTSIANVRTCRNNMIS